MIKFIIPHDHVRRHFPGSYDSGSVFYAKTPADILTYAVFEFPGIFSDATPDPKDGRKRLSFIAKEVIGVSNVVHMNDLTPEEIAAITMEERDGVLVKIVQTNRTFPTKEFHIILDADNTIITMFPGPMAPPLPKNGEYSEFWDRHVFIRPI